MNLDLTFSITAIIAVCALISPIFTALINNNHLYKMKVLDIQENEMKELIDHKRSLLENFMRSAGNTLGVNSFENQKQLAHDFYIILPYLPPNKSELFSAFCRMLSEKDREYPNEAISDMLHNEIVPIVKEMLESSTLHRYKKRKWHKR